MYGKPQDPTEKRMREQGTMVSAGRFASVRKNDTIDLKVPKLLSKKNNKKRDLPAFLSGMMSVSKMSSSEAPTSKKIKEEVSESLDHKVSLPKVDPPLIEDMNRQIQAVAEIG